MSQYWTLPDTLHLQLPFLWSAVLINYLLVHPAGNTKNKVETNSTFLKKSQFNGIPFAIAVEIITEITTAVTTKNSSSQFGPHGARTKLRSIKTIFQQSEKLQFMLIKPIYKVAAGQYTV